jgi:hypothetical protein
LDDGEIGREAASKMEINGFGLVPQVLREFDTNRRVKIVPKHQAP